jgi:hypothetical protein
VERYSYIVELVLTCEWDLNLLYFGVYWIQIVAKLNKLLLKVDHNRRQVPLKELLYFWLILTGVIQSHDLFAPSYTQLVAHTVDRSQVSPNRQSILFDVAKIYSPTHPKIVIVVIVLKLFSSLRIDNVEPKPNIIFNP